MADVPRYERARNGAWSSPVLRTAILLIGVQLALRTWAISGGWFYTDDFRLLYEASRSSLTWEYLLRPYDSQFMPGGRLIALVVERSGDLNWQVVAGLNVLMQALASLACLLMLRSLFRLRWAILGPLAFYLFTVIPFPAFMWWAASLNQLPVQITFFLAVTAWVAYLRTRRPLMALLTWGSVTLGLLFYVKTLLVVPVLGFVAVAYFARGGPVKRLTTAIRRYWLGLLGLGAGAAGFAAFYWSTVPQIVSRPTGSTFSAALLENYAATSFATTAVGGPWLWWQHPEPPTSQLDPPNLMVHVAWVVIVLVVLTTALLRERTLRAWALVAMYLAMSFGLLATSRGEIGPYVGLELRYLTDLAVVVPLGIGLAWCSLLGADEASEPRADPLLRLPYPGYVAAGLVAALSVGGTLSAYGHARIWHDDNPGRDFVRQALSDLEAQEGVVNLADEEAPDDVMIAWTYPHNLLSRLLAVTGAAVRFPRAAERLHTLDDKGRLHPADIETGITDLGGPDPSCGWLVGSAGREIPLTARTLGLPYWIRVGYLASADREVTLTMAEERVRVPLRRGLHDIYVRTETEYDSIRIDGLRGQEALCVSEIEVGAVTPADAP